MPILRKTVKTQISMEAGNIKLMNILEKEIEDVVYESLINYPNILFKKGLIVDQTSATVYFRQFNLGSYGIADLVGACKTVDDYNNKTLEITVFELKKDEINTGTLLQAIGYCKGLDKMAYRFANNYSIKFNIVLLGKTLNKKDSFCYMADFVENLSVYTYSIDLIEGMIFRNEHNYSQKNEMVGCPIKSDRQKFKKLLNPKYIEMPF